MARLLNSSHGCYCVLILYGRGDASRFGNPEPRASGDRTRFITIIMEKLIFVRKGIVFAKNWTRTNGERLDHDVRFAIWDG